MVDPIIIYSLLFLVVIFLIFKLIKKVIFAVLSVVLLIVMIFAGIGGMIYYDYKDLTDSGNLSINVMYGVYNNSAFGVELILRNKTLENKLNYVPFNEDVKNNILEKNPEKIYVFIKKSYYKDLIEDKDKYEILGIGDSYSALGKEFDLRVTKDELFVLLDSEIPLTEYVKYVFVNNNLESLAGLIGGPAIIEEKFRTALGTHQFKELVLATIINNFNKTKAPILLLKGLKDGDVEIYPERFSFKLLKYLPVDLAANLIDTESEKVES